ncbi:putative metal-dependent hydrolase [Bacillus luteolus]|uniref:Putative metal-dependent hydrolase IMZ08_10930 n=1 Tax=Litchfieldia luteola TaxID=682179 RepID=A0ABR9QJ95_9BACI|nr:putative metal-dependent hydrolase [Cytobacillus luteolus]MBE4908570.1 putative metal-dependent hydrolase [Cytobacillus luteolus]MBP1941425.1 putative damage-inducible protein DinB [Cytobacillus luteolus]
MNERYPIGKFQFRDELTSEVIKEWITEIERLPVYLRDAVSKLNEEQLDTPYREGGWTIRQVVHHVADSHMNAFIRIKLALTEFKPVIKTYEEARWAEHTDYILPIENSLTLLESLHKRFVTLLRDLNPSDLQKTFIHPDSGEISIAKNIGIYAWHGRHHLAHITNLTNRKGW